MTAHADVRDVIFKIDFALGAKPVLLIERLQMSLGGHEHGLPGPVLIDIFQSLSQQLVPQLLPTARRGNDHPANDHVTALGFRIEQPGVCYQLVVLPAHQVQGIATEVLPIDVLIGAFLLDDKNLRTQLQYGVELFFAQIGVVFADPLSGGHKPVPVRENDHPIVGAKPGGAKCYGALIKCAARVRSGPS